VKEDDDDAISPPPAGPDAPAGNDSGVSSIAESLPSTEHVLFSTEFDSALPFSIPTFITPPPDDSGFSTAGVSLSDQLNSTTPVFIPNSIPPPLNETEENEGDSDAAVSRLPQSVDDISSLELVTLVNSIGRDEALSFSDQLNSLIPPFVPPPSDALEADNSTAPARDLTVFTPPDSLP
jgi:hypothetical protein